MPDYCDILVCNAQALRIWLLTSWCPTTVMAPSHLVTLWPGPTSGIVSSTSGALHALPAGNADAACAMLRLLHHRAPLHPRLLAANPSAPSTVLHGVHPLDLLNSLGLK